MPSPEECVLPAILARHADQTPERTFAIFADGEEWSYARMRTEALALAAGLAGQGVGQGDKVLIWLPNGKAALRAWFGTNHLGAVSVAINTAYRGTLLEHVVVNSDAELAICHPDLVARLLETGSRGRLRVVATAPEQAAALEADFAAHGITLVPFAALEGDPATVTVPALSPWDTQSICYTSGTTGPSKGVLSSYLHLCTMGRNCTDEVTPEDRFLINLPLFHVGGTLYTMGALSRGASIAVMDRFETASFFRVCADLGATQCLLLGAMAGFLLRSGPLEAEDRHSLRYVYVIPLSEDPRALKARFGFDCSTLFNMSEISAPIRAGTNPETLGAAGRLRPGYDARIVDENDCELPRGTPGELVLRADMPWALSHGYYKMPEATARAWRNGWFHTGDMFRQDESGQFFFVDRAKDAIRRRGENISSFEVEAEVVAHPDILECAVVGVPSEHSEEDVLAVVVPRAGAAIDPAALVQFLAGRMAHFMVPRYVRVIDALPKTPTAKVEKHVLRSAGITPETWDREAHGLVLRAQRLA
ncbi:MAG: AMP-binding protein [Rhodobacteraceae bacterium]|nr:AMP-binding protein [Paracoccaceae bacterium]